MFARRSLPVAGEGRLQTVEQAGRPELTEEIFVRGGLVDREGGLVSGRVVNGMGGGVAGRRKMRV
jgi:hypothetical protein